MKYIETAKVIFLDTNQEESLHTKLNSNCHFFDKFNVGNDNIQLRLDWNDLDAGGFPTLDADFYNLDNGKKRNIKGKRLNSHHTKATVNEGRSYEWVFGECKLKFKVVLVFSVSISESIVLSDSCSAEVIKGS